MSLKEGLIQQTESAINSVAKRRKELQVELEDLIAEEREARDLLQLLKSRGNGDKAPAPQKKTIKQRLTNEDVVAILKDMPDQFSVSVFADALDLTRGQAALWGHRMVQIHRLVYVHKAKPRDKQQTVFRKNF